MKTLREIIKENELSPEDGGMGLEWWLDDEEEARELPRPKRMPPAWIAGEAVLIDFDSGSTFMKREDAEEEFPEYFSEVTRAAAAMGRKGGAAKSERKAAAVRENGKKGGRPRKVE